VLPPAWWAFQGRPYKPPPLAPGGEGKNLRLVSVPAGHLKVVVYGLSSCPYGPLIAGLKVLPTIIKAAGRRTENPLRSGLVPKIE
jgi:hypothetical protein